MQFLVLGANGYLGSYLYDCMERDCNKVIGTKHCGGAGQRKLLPFDILKDSLYDVTKLMDGGEKIAVFCIAQPNIDRCRTEFGLSRQINVSASKEIIESLLNDNFYVIYFSTDNVFDGVKGDYSEEDKTNAINHYGRMKEEMEHFLTERYPEVCIFRLPKVIGAEKEKQNMLAEWENRVDDNEIRCIRGNRMSIIAKEDIYQACMIASRRKMKGIYNLCSGEVYSRKELAEIFYGAIGKKDKRIVELDVSEFGFRDNRPLNIGLNNSKFRSETGYEFISYGTMVEQYCDI